MIDWFRVLVDLKSARVTVRMISRRFGVSLGTINNWKDGTQEPRYSTGAALLEMWRKSTGKSLEDAPRVFN